MVSGHWSAWQLTNKHRVFCAQREEGPGKEALATARNGSTSDGRDARAVGHRPPKQRLGKNCRETSRDDVTRSSRDAPTRFILFVNAPFCFATKPAICATFRFVFKSARTILWQRLRSTPYKARHETCRYRFAPCYDLNDALHPEGHRCLTRKVNSARVFHWVMLQAAHGWTWAIPVDRFRRIKKINSSGLCQLLEIARTRTLHEVDLFLLSWWCIVDVYYRTIETSASETCGIRMLQLMTVFQQQNMFLGWRSKYHAADPVIFRTQQDFYVALPPSMCWRSHWTAPRLHGGANDLGEPCGVTRWADASRWTSTRARSLCRFPVSDAAFLPSWPVRAGLNRLLAVLATGTRSFQRACGRSRIPLSGSARSLPSSSVAFCPTRCFVNVGLRLKNN